MTAPVYQWQPTSLDIAERLGVGVADVIRFDQNTSPLLPDWALSVAGPALARINEYPFADYRTLRQAAAEYCGVSADWVVPGAGADELIGLCASAFLPFRGTAVSAPPTYGLYRIATAHREARLVEVPRLRPTFDLNLAAVIEAARRSDLVWLCVPNNPTGNRDSDEAIDQVLQAASGLVIVDAAYAEFAADQWGPWVETFSNLVVLRTLSKSFSLAGIRLGYAISQPDNIARLDSRRPPGSVSAASAAIGEYALRHPELSVEALETVAAERSRVARELSSLGFTVHPSTTNFVLTRVGPNAGQIADDLMWGHGMVVRTFPTDSELVDHLRITVRSPTDNNRLLEHLKGTLT